MQSKGKALCRLTAPQVATGVDGACRRAPHCDLQPGLCGIDLAGRGRGWQRGRQLAAAQRATAVGTPAPQALVRRLDGARRAAAAHAQLLPGAGHRQRQRLGARPRRAGAQQPHAAIIAAPAGQLAVCLGAACVAVVRPTAAAAEVPHSQRAPAAVAAGHSRWRRHIHQLAAVVQAAPAEGRIALPGVGCTHTHARGCQRGQR